MAVHERFSERIMARVTVDSARARVAGVRVVIAQPPSDSITHDVGALNLRSGRSVDDPVDDPVGTPTGSPVGGERGGRPISFKNILLAYIAESKPAGPETPDEEKRRIFRVMDQFVADLREIGVHMDPLQAFFMEPEEENEEPAADESAGR